MLMITLVLIAGAVEALAASCTIASVAGVALGTYDVFDAAPVDSTGTITYECTGVVETDTVQITVSTGGGGTFSPRAMSAGAETLSYNLYLDAARTVLWGDGTAGTSTYGPLQPAEGQTAVTVFGRVPAGQDVAAGSYSDTVVITVIF
jgi:spore coat protein U-like protein